jgi:hypothetical protein
MSPLVFIVDNWWLLSLKPLALHVYDSGSRSGRSIVHIRARMVSLDSSLNSCLYNRRARESPSVFRFERNESEKEAIA